MKDDYLGSLKLAEHKKSMNHLAWRNLSVNEILSTRRVKRVSAVLTGCSIRACVPTER